MMNVLGLGLYVLFSILLAGPQFEGAHMGALFYCTVWHINFNWVLCLNYTVDLSLCDGTKTPYTLATSLITHISPLLAFRFYQPVYFHLNQDDQQHPRLLAWHLRAHWTYITTFLILTDDTQKVILCSTLCPADDPSTANLSEDPLQLSSPSP